MRTIYEPQSKTYIEEPEESEGLLHFLYQTLPGRILLQCMIARPFFSKLRARYYYSKRSRKKIRPFVEKYQMDMSDWKLEDFTCFNDFFERQKKIEVQGAETQLVAVSDAKLSVYEITEDLVIDVKQSKYTIAEILGQSKNQDLLDSKESFAGGSCLVFRLGLNDYHRYLFPANGCIKEQYLVKGMLHTVRPISKNYRVYARNKRSVSILETKPFGTMAMIEVGALLVGGIINEDKIQFSRGEEKGHFAYGGSTIVLLVPQSVSIDSVYYEQTKMGYETKVRAGSVIGSFVYKID